MILYVMLYYAVGINNNSTDEYYEGEEEQFD
jgi:hypothetical protein